MSMCSQTNTTDKVEPVTKLSIIKMSVLEFLEQDADTETDIDESEEEILFEWTNEKEREREQSPCTRAEHLHSVGQKQHHTAIPMALSFAQAGPSRRELPQNERRKTSASFWTPQQSRPTRGRGLDRNLVMDNSSRVHKHKGVGVTAFSTSRTPRNHRGTSNPNCGQNRGPQRSVHTQRRSDNQMLTPARKNARNLEVYEHLNDDEGKSKDEKCSLCCCLGKIFRAIFLCCFE